jgi:formylglycine-generating enzyme required for sulfatase activity
VWKKVETGTRTITWRPDLSWPDHKIADGGARAVVTAWATDNTPDYMVVDISDGAQRDTQRYYPAADFVPGGVANALYKTTMLLMRKIMAKDVTWTMGSTTLETQNRQAAREATHQVTLTNNYYIGVYEVTQSQWSQVATNSTISANFTTERFMRPMEKVCYNEIRLKYNSNAAATANEIADYSWPKKPNPSSFLGLLRTKTGLDFDLPSEAQWEFAARAGNGVGYWNDGSAILNTNPDDNLKLLGRYERNGGKVLSGTSYVDPAASCGATNGTAIVGSYAPNAWGLYDMHGNVWEWCLDWYADDITAHGGKVNIDPATPANTLSGASGANRVNRGGSWYGAAGGCRPAFRNYDAPATRNNSIGFRVVCTAGLR